jgi:hypothetical protein
MSAGAYIVSSTQLPTLYNLVNHSHEITPEGITNLAKYLLKEADDKLILAKKQRNQLHTYDNIYK